MCAIPASACRTAPPLLTVGFAAQKVYQLFLLLCRVHRKNHRLGLRLF